MDKKAVGKILGLAVIALFAFWAINNSTQTVPVQESPEMLSVTVTIEDLYVNKELRVAAPQSVLGVLQQLDAEDEGVHLGTKEYSGMGVLVERIGNKTNGASGEYWQYNVNGVMPQVSADKYEVTNGDSIEWYFDKSDL